MGKEAFYIFGFVAITLFVYTKAQNLTIATLPPFTLPPYCISDGIKYNIGDEWKPSPFLTCKCTGPASTACLMVMVCFDNQQKQRQPGDKWLENPTSYCTCTVGNFVLCQKLDEPVCMDKNGNLRKYNDTWISSSCVDCLCINGSIICTGYDVNVTYGLYSVASYPTCEKCDIPSRMLGKYSTCKVYREVSAKGMFQACASERFYIRDIQRCNGIRDCPDGSDEKDCDNVICKDEEENSFLIKDDNGWPVSQCMNCYCKNGLLSCRRKLSINFPGYFEGIYEHNENCEQSQCNVAKFLKEKKDECEAVEFTEDDGIYFKDQTWKYKGCDFYFPGAHEQRNVCPPMTRPACYVYNGAICCATQCPGLEQTANELRGNLSFCSNDRLLVSKVLQCTNSTTNSSEVTCQDEDSVQYFEGAKWSVGECMNCSCDQGRIHCLRKLVLASFLIFSPKIQFASEITFTEHCNQTNCNVANFMKRNYGVCHACRWNNKLYYDGDHWKENGVDFYCSSSKQKFRPGCYVENSQVTCTGAIQGIREMSLISRDDLFLCDSGDEIISLGDRCNFHPDCYDRSDERNCSNYYCSPEESLGIIWNRTKVGGEILKECSAINPNWTGEFGSKCTNGSSNIIRTAWLHKNTCDCEKKALLEYFEEKIAGVNQTNFMNISQAIASSAEAGNFTNPKAFHDMFKNMFNNVTRILTPLTLQNADLALKYCQHIIQTVLSNSVYKQQNSFCYPKLANDRNFLASKALEFLRQAPNNTEAYIVGSTLGFSHVTDPKPDDEVKDNFNPARPQLGILRTQLILQLNTAPRLPANVDKPTPEIINNNNVTGENGTGKNSTTPTSGSTTKELTIQEIIEALKARNCKSVTYDEAKEVFIYNHGLSNKSLKHEEIQSKMELVLICISISAIVLALILLTALRLKRSERLFIHKSLLLSLGLANLIYVLDKNLFVSRQDRTALCSAVTVIQFYFQTALFTWMLVEGMNLYIKLVKVFSVKRQYVAYVAIGWGIPAIIVGLVAAIKPTSFDMGIIHYEDITCGSLKLIAEVLRTRCWINGSLWIYKGPILVILVANVVLFVILLRVIFGKLSSKYARDRVKISKRGLKSIVALLPLLGVTWLVGFFIEFHIAVGYMFILLNSTQGIVFFIFHCVLDDQVQDAIRKLCAKKRADSRTRTTPASNQNTTPVMERNSRINVMQNCDDETQMVNGTTKDGTRYNETNI